MDKERWLKDVSGRLCRKMDAVIQRNADCIPYMSENGRFLDCGASKIYWWTNGFWPGLLWQMYYLTGKENYARVARTAEEKLDANLMMWNRLDHDCGFKWSLSAVADYRLTKNEASKNRGLLAAGALAARYNPAGQFLRAWNPWENREHLGLIIIDCMMNLPLLYWASQETGDPRYRQIATRHADTALRYLVREDGSVAHQADFDPETGIFLGTYGGQGYQNGSSWTRGQAWGLYGFALSYHYTGNPVYQETAERIARYFLANIPANGHIPVDFRQPPNPWREDASAAACAASGLLVLADLVDSADKARYQQAAMTLLQVLDQDNADWSPLTDPILHHCAVAYHEGAADCTLIYADYFFVEAVLHLQGKSLLLW